MKNQSGFTLIELAIVLVIMTILIGGLAVPLTAQIQARRIAETHKTLEAARDAIHGYAMTHSSYDPNRRLLPCPDTTGDGREDREVSGNGCTAYAGWLPWVDLGTAAQDAWGNRIRYAVHPPLARMSDGLPPPATPTDMLSVCTLSTCSPNSPDVAANVAFVLMSHGPNGWGGRNVSGSTLAAPTGANELANLDTDRVYVSRPPSQPDHPAGEYDDIVQWTDYYGLIVRICPTGSACSP